MSRIILTTLNSRYTHTSIALRYLYANLKEYQQEAKILEFVINSQMQSIAEKILDCEPEIIGIGVYIWNVSDVQELIDIIKKVSPSTKIVLGGPEVSHTPFRVNLDSADYVIQGEGEIGFYNICRDILNNNPPKEKFIKAHIPNVLELELPYSFYSKHDIDHRYSYVEASRGCPFECEFCLSSIDERVRYFDIDKLLVEFEILWQKGVRSFKFIDRTFNLNIKIANKLIDFFLSKQEEYFLHFEVIPDHFPDSLKKRIKLFPSASLQLEIGIQTLNLEVAKGINRNLKLDIIKKNIEFLEKETKAHMHLDLIIGLPNETLESFGKNLNELVSLTKSEIQIGILKKLSGTTLNRHDRECGMRYSDKPPYDILQNNLISYKQMQKMKRFARFWDLTYNSGNFYNTVQLIWQKDRDVYSGFLNYSQWIYAQTESTWQISLNRLSELLFKYISDELNYDKQVVADSILQDIIKVDGRRIPGFLREFASYIPDLRKKGTKHNIRQQLRS